MNCFRVGGAVRDELLGYPFDETDWVVIGSTERAMVEAGYLQIGRDFPVFLHPSTREEYALARTERKSGHGHLGFIVHSEPTVTLEEDLGRRDLTINAMAMSESGEIIDPYGGQEDLKSRTLRHVSNHFSEDPLRVLRVARFAARYHSLGFRVAEETLSIMTKVVISEELAHLSMERIWSETDRALGCSHPEIYFDTLQACGAMEKLFPAVSVTHGVELLSRASKSTDQPECRWAALLSPLPKKRANQMNLNLKAPKRFFKVAELVCFWLPKLKDTMRSSEGIHELLVSLNAFQHEQPFGNFCKTLAALDNSPVEEHSTCLLLAEALKKARSITASSITDKGINGPSLGKAIDSLRKSRIEELVDAGR